MLESAHSMYRMNAPYAKWYRFSLDDDKNGVYRGDFHGDDDFGPYQYMYDLKTGEIKENPAYQQTAYASLDKTAINPLQEPPVTPSSEVGVPDDQQAPTSLVEKTDEAIPVGERVIVLTDYDTKEAGFEGKLVSNFKQKGDNYSVVEMANGTLVDVHNNRVVKASNIAKKAATNQAVIDMFIADSFPKAKQSASSAVIVKATIAG